MRSPSTSAAAVSDDAVRAVVLTHTGGTFCAGADLKEQAAEGGPAEGTRRMLALLRTIVELPKPVITRVDGHVRAGGIGLVGASDIALAGPRTTFAFTEVRLGLAPAIISLTTLGRMSERAAARYYLTGETFDATTAAAAGLVTAAVDDVDAELAAVCDALRACSPQGLAETKPLTTAAARAASPIVPTRRKRCRSGCSSPTRRARACSRSCRSARPRGCRDALDPRAATGPQPGDPRPAAGGGDHLSRRTRLPGEHRRGRRGARRCVPRCGAAPLPDPRGAVHGRARTRHQVRAEELRREIAGCPAPARAPHASST